jgi:hypothetical protein
LAAAWVFFGPWSGSFESTAQWNTWVVPIVVVSIIAGIAIYMISERTRGGKTDAQLLAEVTAAGGGSAE